ncbi:MAG TPA: gamma-glutamyl-gamma-aminobutyrate hydrolase family protein [Pyrinomonadaceae bacterium]|nr:gamma-glutamyl-gamma-aminobutyrate hydrolase family protein [Pyrinomonadaceae bacterium]
MSKPRIGITMRLEMDSRRFYLGRDYSEAIEVLGGVPFHLSLIPSEAYIAAALKNLDGILLPGSDTDVDPFYFGEEPHPKLKQIVPEKEQTDFLVLAEAERLKMPLLGICFGMQALNIARGGSVFQDIEAQIPDALKHEQGKPLERSSHAIEIEQESLLARLSKNKTDARVNSHHHQSIKALGENLKATARAKDGVIEAVEDTRADRFVLGVQWHPELSWKTDELSRNIFETFIANCK